MPTGKVEWFDPTKGFGFIVPDDGGPGVFWHFGIKPADRLVVGPFLFTDEFGVTDVLYCDADKLAATQAEFVARFPH